MTARAGWPSARVLLALIALSQSAAAADFWERTHGRRASSERETLEAIFRAEAGTSDSVDELHVRVAIVDVARGKKYGQELTLVYVLRTRRLLGLANLPGEFALLEAIVQGNGPSEAVALAALELARIHRLSGDLPAARVELDRALGRAWRSEIRVEAHVMRAFLGVEEGDLERARADFQSALAFDLARPLLALTLEGLALVDLLRGDLLEARRLLKRARELESGSGAIVPIAPSARPELLPKDQKALLELGPRVAESAGHGDEDHLDP